MNWIFLIKGQHYPSQHQPCAVTAFFPPYPKPDPPRTYTNHLHSTTRVTRPLRPTPNTPPTNSNLLLVFQLVSSFIYSLNCLNPNPSHSHQNLGTYLITFTLLFWNILWIIFTFCNCTIVDRAFDSFCDPCTTTLDEGDILCFQVLGWWVLNVLCFFSHNFNSLNMFGVRLFFFFFSFLGLCYGCHRSDHPTLVVPNSLSSYKKSQVVKGSFHSWPHHFSGSRFFAFFFSKCFVFYFSFFFFLRF